MRVVLEVEDSKKGYALINFLKNLSFVKIEDTFKRKRKKNKFKIEEVFGIWKDRDLTKEKLREKAWRI